MNPTVIAEFLLLVVLGNGSKFNVHYEKLGSNNVNSPPVLFLPGFGVGSFHYEKQLKDLGRDYRLWAVDFLGQGMSLPSEDPTQSKDAGNSEGENSVWGFGDETEPWANELVYSIDVWCDQVQYFIEESDLHVGEVLSGLTSADNICSFPCAGRLHPADDAQFRARNPQLVKGVTLLNAMPFWGFLPNPIGSPRLARMFPWAGTFPLQKAHRSSMAQHPAAAAASLASIMFAPQGQLGLQVKRQMPEAPYYEISPAGHCPHDEVPEVGPETWIPRVLLNYLRLKTQNPFSTIFPGIWNSLGKDRKDQ
ncbi:pheophytinase [Actinidia rufa]|uniref:Pheophytinase n=1 Tax=Actinidia rufa TaxID=165716 RepID=A0A7J0FPA8_9ERIC|nr:pheophytinase [Actinidia rufa]